ncbi:MAG: hypothetical protein QM654_06905 [Dysgonamonadaceae bacterium]
MKKLSKIRLHNAIVMNDREMKSVTGGFVTGGEDSGSSSAGDCPPNAQVCGGDCYITGTLIKGSCEWLVIEDNNGNVRNRLCACIS